MLVFIEKQVFEDAPCALTIDELDVINKRVKEKYPNGVNLEHQVTVDIDDILCSYPIAYGTSSL